MLTAVRANETRERGKRKRNGKGKEGGKEGKKEAGRKGGRGRLQYQRLCGRRIVTL